MARRGNSRKKTSSTGKAEWRRMLEADPLVQELVKRHHKHLERAKIIVLGKPKASKVAGKVNIAKAKRVTPPMAALLKELAGEDVHYVVEVGLDAWDALETKTRRIVLDHELCHFTGQDGDSGKWGLRGHDIQEFTAILERHGAWNIDLQLFCKAATQLELGLGAK